MNGNLLKWSLWCDTCDCERQSDYIPEADGEPTVCPYNHDHTNVRDQTIVDVKDMNVQPVKEIDVEDLDPLFARSSCEGVNFDAVAEGWTKENVSWPYRVNILNGEGFTGFVEDGDKSEFRIVPSLIGGVAVLAGAGATAIVVDDGIKALFAEKVIFPGMFFKFRRDGVPGYPDNPNPQEDEYRIESFEPSTNTVTLNTGLATEVPQGSLVYLVIKYGQKIEHQTGEEIDVGGRASGSATIPENTVFECWFYNSGVSAKRVRLRMNLKYGPLRIE